MSTNAVDASQPVAAVAGTVRNIEQLAWDWLSKHRPEHPNDVTFDSDDMVDAFIAGCSSRHVVERLREPTPDMIAAAWKAFRGDRPGKLLGPGPAFKEALAAMIAAAGVTRSIAVVLGSDR